MDPGSAASTFQTRLALRKLKCRALSILVKAGCHQILGSEGTHTIAAVIDTDGGDPEFDRRSPHSSV